MIPWTNRVPDTPEKFSFTLHRTPADRPLRGIVIQEDLLGCNTHFWTKRTVPCTDKGCPACAAAMPSRWHAYVAAIDPANHVIFLFEATAKAALAFEQYRDTYKTLRGCHFSASRPKRQKNAAVQIMTKPADLNRFTLPPPIDLKKALSVIWQLPASALETPIAEHGTPTIHPDPDTIAQALGDQLQTPEAKNHRPKRKQRA